MWALVWLLGPGFAGGGYDDGKYLAIAHEWLAYGPSIPANHWESRWPAVLPLAISLKLFGLHRWSVALPSMIEALISLALIKRLGDKYFGRSAGITAAAIFAILPAFSYQATSSTIELPELMFILAGFSLLERPALAGIAIGLAFQARETCIAALPPLLWLARDWRGRALILSGFLAPLALEMAAFYGLTGDPLFRRHLALAHASGPNGDLPGLRTGRPLFNPAVIADWRRELGIRIYWPIDGYLNLIPNPALGGLPLLVLLQFLRIGRGDRRLSFLLLSAAFYSAALIYALAIFPTPRMFLPALAALAIAFGAMCARRWDAVSITCAGAFAFISLALSLAQPSSAHWQRIAEGWLADHPGQIETRQQSYWTFSPALRRLPRAGRPYRLSLEDSACRSERLPVEAMDSGGPIASVFFGSHWHLCLFADGAALGQGRPQFVQ